MQKLDHRPELDHSSKKKGLQIIQNSTIQSLCSYRVGQGQLMPCCRCFSSVRGSSFSYMERRWSISIGNRGVGMTKCLVGTSPCFGDNLPHRIGLTNLPKNEGDWVPCPHTFRRLLDKHRKPSQSSSFELSQGRCQSAQRLCERKVKEFAPLSNVSILIKMHQKASKRIMTNQNVSKHIKITDQNVSKWFKTHQNASKRIKTHQKVSKQIKTHQNVSTFIKNN